jgi:dihydrodipicolinate synthase/N-acetylneuraminate lyase
MLEPADYAPIKAAVPNLVGVKVVDLGDKWYAQMRQYARGISVFISGHRLATGITQGAHGAYSNVACLQPLGAQRWYEQILTDRASALRLEQKIQQFMADYIAPFITSQHYANQAVDKLMAAVGGWADIGPRLRWPYRSISEDAVQQLRPMVHAMLPELFED